MHPLTRVAFVLAAARPAAAQRPALPLPPVTGVSIVQTLTMREGDRESVYTVEESSAKGLRWIWRFTEVHTSGDTLQETYRYAERSADVATAVRMWLFHGVSDSAEHPGYTMHALSRAVYGRLRAAGSDSFQVMALESVAVGGGLAALGLGRGRVAPVRWRGTLSLASPTPVPFPLLVNGQRVEVPALHLRGRFIARGKQWEPELWVLGDSTYPLLLKWVGSQSQTENVLQTVRLDAPSSQAGVAARELERGLASTCRVELPGIYFAFNSAVLDSASNRILASVADVLRGHRDWKVTLEGHTDSIGSAAANRALSERRVEAVRARLVSAFRIEGGRLGTAGYGSTRPRETNTTIEGRARNRRVELARECAKP